MIVRACLLLASLLFSVIFPVYAENVRVRVPENRSSSSAATKPKRARVAKWVYQDSQVRSLPGWLDKTLVLNSNSPEIVYSNGILVSTFPPEGKKEPTAHLNKSLEGNFDIFAHHIAKPDHGDKRTLYLGLLLQNPDEEPVTVSVKQAASFLTKFDAPYIRLPDFVESPRGRIFAGAGDRLTDFILRKRSQTSWIKSLKLAPGEYRMLFVLPVSTNKRARTNCRSTLVKANSTGSIYAACLAMRAPRDAKGRERQPILEEWKELLATGSLATPRDKAPTEPKSTRKVIYGRVAGVSRGATWSSQICEDSAGRFRLNIPHPGKAYSYVFSSLEQGAFGTMNYQSAPMVVRYPDTAHRANGNYGVRYKLSLPLYNPTSERRRVTVAIQCPYKSNRPHRKLLFRDPPMKRIFYRGTFRVHYRDDDGVNRLRYIHLVLHQADQGKPLVKIELNPRETRPVLVDFLYPPDSTPPQILTVKTLDD